MNDDPLLSALTGIRQRREVADYQIRVLLAYAREIAAPAPYRLADLAQAAGMSISGVRTAYGPDHIQHAAQILGLGGQGSRDTRHLTHAVSALLGSPDAALPSHH